MSEKSNLIKWLDGRPIITMDDFEMFMRIRIKAKNGGYRYGFFRREYFIPAKDYNGWGQGEIREQFERLNNVHYEEETFIYMYIPGVFKAIDLLINKKVINVNSKKIIYIINEIEKYITYDSREYLLKKYCK